MGVGVDLVETCRIRACLDRWGDRFTAKVFCANERRYCDARPVPARHYAGRFAVKEAVSKAFGTGIGTHIGWLDMEVTRNPDTGAPTVRFSDRARTWMNELGVTRVWVSLSHTRRYAVAQAVLEGERA